MKDALGNPVIEEEIYGYSQSANGFAHVVIGKVKKINEKNVTLKPISKIRAVYHHEPEPQEIGKDVSVKGILLFPVDIAKINSECFFKPKEDEKA